MFEFSYLLKLNDILFLYYFFYQINKNDIKYNIKLVFILIYFFIILFSMSYNLLF